MEPRQRIVALTVACALFMQTLDMTILGTALPAIGRSFSIDPVRLHLAMTSYLIALAVFMPMSGWVADKYGTRTVFRVAIFIFVAASVGCGYSQSVWQLAGMRVIQGMGGAMMMPVARLALLRAVPKSSLVQAMTWVSVPALLGPLVGPPIGGALVTYASWPWIFWMNVPIGLLGIVLATIFFENLKAEESPKFDRTGATLSAISLSTLLFGFELAPHAEIMGGTGWILIGLGLVTAFAYIRHARNHPDPIIDLRLLSVPTFRISLAGGALFRFGMGATPFLLPLMLQEGFNRTAISSGLIMFATAAGGVAMKFAAPYTLARIGFRRVLVFNAGLAALSIAIIGAFTQNTPALVMIGLLFVGGFFRSLQFTAINAIGFADLDEKQMSRATGFSSMVQQLSLSLGVSIAALLLQIMPRLHGEALVMASDYSYTFFSVALLVGCSMIFFSRLERDAGSHVSNHVTSAGGAARPPSDPRV